VRQWCCYHEELSIRSPSFMWNDIMMVIHEIIDSTVQTWILHL
jgi:hypothetical protein